MVIQQKLKQKGIDVDFMKGSALKEEDLQAISDPQGGETIVVIDDATVSTTQSNELGICSQLLDTCIFHWFLCGM